MRPLYSTNEWPALATYDIEADEWTKVCLVCHIDEYENKVNFPTVGKYLDWLFESFSGDVVFAHAGGHYDHRFLLAEAKDRGWDFRTAISGGSIVILTISNGKRQIKFGDSFRLMPDSLKKIGETVGLPKLDVDPSKMYELSEKEKLDYCFRDCEIVLKGLQLMRKVLTSQGADFAFTLASIASRFNRRNMGINWDHFVIRDGRKTKRNPKIDEWDKLPEKGKPRYHPAMDAYHGGRCEMYERDTLKGPIYWYDIVSSYPRSMCEDLPLYYKGIHLPPRNLKNPAAFLSHPGITQCEVYVPPSVLTVLPCISSSGRLIFPQGELEGKWTNIELLEALNQGAEIRKFVCQWRFQAEPFLRKFVHTFYKLRQDAKNRKDEFSSYAYKILLNSSYGKLVETVERVSYISQGEIERLHSEGAEIETTETQGVFKVKSVEVGPFRHAAAGAYITAHSRLRLFRKAIEMVNRGARILYCDTDSLMLTQPIPESETGKNLGDWEYVATLKELELVLPKVYRAVKENGETIYKCKGCPIVRKFESEDMAAKRWEAFKTYQFEETEELAQILGKDGVTGFGEDVKFGSLHPRRRSVSCKICNKTGVYKGVECPSCNGTGNIVKPLVRSLKSGDKKREWSGNKSKPLTLSMEKPRNSGDS